MHINITGKGLLVTEAIKQHIENGIKDHFNKYISENCIIDVIICKDGTRFKTDINIDMKEKFSPTLHVSAFNSNAYSSIDEATFHALSKIRKYKSKFKKNNRTRNSRNIKSYIIDNNIVNDMYELTNEDAKLVFDSKSIKLQELSVAEAIMEMDMNSLNAILFINIKNTRINMIYKNTEQQLILVDTEED